MRRLITTFSHKLSNAMKLKKRKLLIEQIGTSPELNYTLNDVPPSEKEPTVNEYDRELLELAIHTALTEQQFSLLYQPQYDIHKGTLRGFEALIRWNHPDLGLIHPLEFIPLAEETRLIIPIGEWVLHHACDTLQKIAPAPSNLSISVNISVIQLMDDMFVEQVQKALQQSNINPRRLELELTEVTLMKSPEVAKKQLKKLQKLGVQLALEDYGEIEPLNNSLLDLPLHTIKIYKSFAKDISRAYKLKDLSLLLNRIEYPQLKIVVEGIESYDQLAHLQKVDCDIAQGYLFSLPLSEDEVLALIHSEKSSHS